MISSVSNKFMNYWVWKGIIDIPTLPTFRNEFVRTSEASILLYHKAIIGLKLVATKKAIVRVSSLAAILFWSFQNVTC